MYDDLKGKAAFVSGAGNEAGLGFAITRKLAENGVDVCLADLPINASEGERLAKKLQDSYGVNAFSLNLDVTSLEAIEASVETVQERFDRLDILINNAGSVFGAPSTVAEYDDEAWLKTIDVNLHSVFRVSKAFYPLLKESKGAVVNTASTAAKGPHGHASAYAVSKTGVVMLTKVMAIEAGPFGIRVNAICPGLIMTDLQRFRINKEAELYNITPEERERQLNESVPLKRIASPSEVAAVVTFLASEEASYVTGQALNICGGRTTAL